MKFPEKIVITGVGVISPIGEGKENYWNGLKSESNGIREITLFNSEKYGSFRAGEITDFNAEQYLGKKGLKYLSRTTQLAMSAAFLCLKDSKIKNADREFLSYDSDSIGVVLGTTYGVLQGISAFDQVSLSEGPHYVSPMAFQNLVMNSHAGYLAIKENIRGLNMTISTGYNSALDSMGIGIQYLLADQIKCLLIGGVEELSEEFFLSYLHQGSISDVLNIGEGAAIFSIEKLEDANNRKAKIYAKIVSYSNVFDPTTEGLGKAVQLSIKDADISIGDIDWIVKSLNTGTIEKKIESDVLADIFDKNILFSDLSRQIGDSYSASGSFQIAEALRLIEKALAKTVLVVSIDPHGSNSALIISKC